MKDGRFSDFFASVNIPSLFFFLPHMFSSTVTQTKKKVTRPRIFFFFKVLLNFKDKQINKSFTENVRPVSITYAAGPSE